MSEQNKSTPEKKDTTIGDKPVDASSPYAASIKDLKAMSEASKSPSTTSLPNTTQQGDGLTPAEQQRYNNMVNGLIHELNSTQPADPVTFLNKKLSSASLKGGLKRTTAAEDSSSKFPADLTSKALTIVVMGASGDLAKKKTFPALYKLHKQKLLPPHTRIVGYARSAMTPEEFHSRITSFITIPKIKLQPKKESGEEQEEDQDGKKKKDEEAEELQEDENEKRAVEDFKKVTTYLNGQYNSAEDLAKLDTYVKELEAVNGGPAGNRVFYLALPPSAFVDTCTSIHASAVPSDGWIRIVVEKPFGSDTESSNKLSLALGKLFKESQLYRIDHYLGKEMVQNLVTLRFANHVFGALWNRNHIHNVQITFKEKIGTQGRGGYFDNFGIIRDVIQNHLTQILALVAMEKPRSLSAEHIRDEKVAVLECIQPVKASDCILGQYTKSADGKEEGYLDDKTVPAGSKCPTFASMVLNIENDRWQGVPFVMKAGKAMDKKMVTVRIQFRDEVRPFGNQTQRNELVIRMQPDEAMYMKISTKEPGVSQKITQTELDLSYHQRFTNLELPEAYESLINEVVNGNTTNFVRSDELEAAWKIFTPVLHEIDAGKVEPIPYEFGTRGPKEADDLLENQVGFKRNEDYEWNNRSSLNK